MTCGSVVIPQPVDRKKNGHDNHPRLSREIDDHLAHMRIQFQYPPPRVRRCRRQRVSRAQLLTFPRSWGQLAGRRQSANPEGAVELEKPLGPTPATRLPGSARACEPGDHSASLRQEAYTCGAAFDELRESPRTRTLPPSRTPRFEQRASSIGFGQMRLGQRERSECCQGHYEHSARATHDSLRQIGQAIGP